ncbi:MAG TPA: NADH-quinone oxidoreductase subunit N [Chloroflexota bacterium]|nr:NADH-quinone oxidoreductase subunit N [Chloroflexota bacterium]
MTSAYVAMPEIVVTVLAMLMLLFEAVLREKQKRGLTWLALLGFVVALALNLYQWGGGRFSAYNDAMVVDNFTVFFNTLFLATAILVVLMAPAYLKERALPFGEFYCLLSFAVLGMMFTAASTDLITLFVSIELMVISVYILAGLARREKRSNEACLKYFLLGAFASAILVYGMSWLYGVSGQTNLAKIAAFVQRTNLSDPLLLISIGILAVGIGFKVALVPFHAWTPDAYEGAPTPATAFMSVGPKAAAFAALLRIFVTALGPAQPDYSLLFGALAAATMTLGNLVAIQQNNIKRMLAYSSIAHSGYIMVGMAAFRNGSNDTVNGVTALMFYLFVYTFMTLGAFAIVAYVQAGQAEAETFDDYRALGRRAPLTALAMTIFMLSLTGVPPLAGFMGKVYLILATVNSGMVWLAVIIAVNSAISAYYYLRVVVVMYMNDTTERVPLYRSPFIHTMLAFSALATFFFGVFANQFMAFAQGATGL